MSAATPTPEPTGAPFPELLRRLLAGGDLDVAETETLLGRIMDGELTDSQKAGLLVALAAKGETPAEITGAARAMRRRAVRIPHALDAVLDTCGTGGDGRGTFNVSTAAALVAAAGGVFVAKHGNRSISSRSGSADVLAALGVSLELGAEALARCLEQCGIAFLFAPAMHPAMREVMPVRRELGVRTLFNVLGPLTNPAGADRQLLGVYARQLVEPVAVALRDLGTHHALVVHGSDGLDEITTTGTTWACEVHDGEVRPLAINPEALGLTRRSIDDLRGGDPAENAATMRRVLAGEPGPLSEITALNGGAALWVGGRAESLEHGLATARELLAAGAALAKLELLVEHTTRHGGDGG